MGIENVDWAALNAKLPIKKDDPAQKAKRKELFKRFDPNGNGILSLAEIDKSIRDYLKIDALFDAKPAIMRAFQIAKGKSNGTAGAKADYIEFSEFRFFLLSLRQYFEYYVAFTRIDESGDRKITLEEFIMAKDKIETWVGKIDDMKKEFHNIDTNGGGEILFDEFVNWAIKKNLDLEDDEDIDE